MVSTRRRLLISPTKVPTTFSTLGTGRESCPDQLAHLIAAVLADTLWPFVLCRPTSEFKGRDTPARSQGSSRCATSRSSSPVGRHAMVHGSAFRLQRLSSLERDEAEAAVVPVQRH